MTLKKTSTIKVAAAKAGFNRATGYRLAAGPSQPGSRAVSMKRSRRDFTSSSVKIQLRLIDSRFFDNKGWVAELPTLADQKVVEGVEHVHSGRQS